MEFTRRKFAAAFALVGLMKSPASAEKADPIIAINRKVTVRLSQIAQVELVEWINRDDPEYNCWLNIFLKGYHENLANRDDYVVQTELMHPIKNGMTDNSRLSDPLCPIDPLELKQRIERLMAKA